jgi:nucleoside-diphosphate-sugar epimerase
MKVLFIGGTGNISTSCTHDAVARGIELCHLNRGSAKGRVPDEVQTLIGDIRSPDDVRRMLNGLHFDAVVDWIAFTPDHIRTDLELFRDRTNQFIFISSASVYHKPVRHHIITESTPAHNPYWKYSANKIACEELLRSEYVSHGFPMTIVRPSHTYSDGWFPTTFSHDYTVPQRMLDGKPVVVHGDGSSLWTITHTDDFARGFNGLLGNPQAIGETFHITGDEALTWDEIHRTIGQALGVAPKIVHIPSEIIARLDPDIGPGLIGDKQFSVVFDNAKIKRYVPGYQATIPFHEGMRRSVRWVESIPGAKKVNAASDAFMDRLVAAMDGIR